MLLFSLCHRWASALLLGTAALAAHAQDWQAPNPYRTTEPARLAQLQADGRAAYTQHCARCHGADAVRPMAEAPDLRRLNSVCVRLKNEALARRCQQDVDAYFSQSVQEGKVRAGIEHMPAWRDTLAPGTAWAIQLFIEGQPKPLPRTQTRVDTAQGH